MLIMMVVSLCSMRKKTVEAVIVNGNDEITLPVEIVNEIPQM